MGRIKKTATDRHTATLSDAVAEFVKDAAASPLHELPGKLASFPQQWPFPRGDLYHWITLLDRFDHVLELFNAEYGLRDGPQQQPFERRLLLKGDGEENQPWPAGGAKDLELDARGFSADGDRELVEAILHFTRILLEHCGNRSLYASSNHLNDLLHTTSLSVLRLCLKLSLRLAQRYQVARFKNNLPQAQHALLANHYAFNLDNLHKLAMPFPKPAASIAGASLSTPVKSKEKFSQTQTFNPNDLVLIAKNPHALSSNTALSGVTLVYYDQKVKAPSTATLVESMDVTPSTPTPTRRSSALASSRGRPWSGDRSVSSNDVSAKSKEPEGEQSSASQTFFISPAKVSDLTSTELVRESLALVPKDSQYDLLNRIRIAKALSTPETHAQELLEVRLLAIANLLYALNESKIQEKIGIPDSEEPRRYSLAQQLCDLLQPPTTGQKPLDTQFETTILMTIEALTKSRHKISEVADALSVSVNHGVLYYELRKVIGSVIVESNVEPSVELQACEWRDATFDLINSLQQANVQARYGERMVAAGIMDIMLEALASRTSRAERLHEKILSFFTSFFHNIPSAFQTLAASKGLDIIADLSQYCVSTAMQSARDGKGLPPDCRSKVIDYTIPFYLQSTIRQLFKFTVHMFEHSAGTHDRLLRNFIDTPQILESLKIVIENATVFGSNVWSGALNIMSSFIHNEPTSYQVIGEAGLSKSLLEAVTGSTLPADLPNDVPLTDDDLRTDIPFVNGEPEYPSIAGILPVGETMSDIPAAFGAICLNEAGMQAFQASKALIKFFDIFVSPAHVKALEDEGQTASNIGQAFDELSRHHPRLKDHIIAAALSMVKRVGSLCRGLAEYKFVGAKLWEKNEVDGKWYISGGQAAMAGSSYNAGYETISSPATSASNVSSSDIGLHERENAMALPYLSACFKFFEGFFHNASMCSAFCAQGGVESLLDLATSPSNPYDLVAFPVFGKIAHVLKTMCENKPHLVLPSILHRTQKAVHALKPIMDSSRPEGAFAEYTGVTHQDDVKPIVNGTVTIKALTHAHLFADILSRIFAPPHYPSRHSSQSNQLFTTLSFTDVYLDLVENLSKLHASSIWENLALQKYLSQETKEKSDPKPFVPRRIDTNGFVEIGIEKNSESGDSDVAASPSTNVPLSDDIIISKNAKAVRFLFSQSPASTEGFFRSLGQALVPKRSNDLLTKQHAALVAERLAKCAIEELTYQKYEDVDETMSLKYTWGVLCAVTHIMLRNSFSIETYNYKEAITLVMQKFYVHKGFGKLNEITLRFSDVFRNKEQSDPNEQSEFAAREGLKTILDFYNNVVRSKCITESSQSVTLCAPNHKQADYFMPGQFVVEIRDAILPAISKLWFSNSIEKVGDHHAKQVVEILRVILRAEGEDRALKKSDHASRRVPINKPDFSLRNSNLVSSLQSQGFAVALAREALYRCNNHEQNSIEYCRLRQDPQTLPLFPIPNSDTMDEQHSAPGQPSDSSSHHPPVDMDDASDEQNGFAREEARTELSLSDIQSSEVETASDDQGSGGPLGIPAGVGEQDLIDMVGHDRLQDILSLAGNPTSSGPPAQDTRELFITVDDLDEKRSALRAALIERCLEVLSVVPNVTFELADLIRAAVAKSGEGANPRADIGSTLVSSLFSLKGEENDKDAGVKISAYAHLVALILQDRDFFDSTLDELKEYFNDLVSWVKLGPGKKPEDAPWMEMILLIIERVLAEDEQPVSLSWIPPPADDPLRALPSPDIPTAVVSNNLREELFDALVEVLPRIGKNTSLALSTTRVLVMLTRRTAIADRLRQKSSMSRLFVMIRQMAGSVDEKLQSSFMLILRHLIEDQDTVREIMRTEIKAAFESHRSSRGIDTATYTRNLFHLVLRSPDVFVQITQEMLEIVRFDGNPNRPQQLALKRDHPSKAEDKPEQSDAKPSVESDTVEMPKPVENRFPTVENADGVISYLLRELSNYKDVEDRPPTSGESKDGNSSANDTTDSSLTSVDASMTGVTDSTTSTASNNEEGKSEKAVFKSEDHPIFVYRCFILQCLSELLASYTKTKVEFINFSRKPDTAPPTPSKPRAGTLNYLLNVVIPLGTLEHKDETLHRKKQATSYWAQMVLVALCAKTQEKPSNAQTPSDEPELGFVRKFVIEHAIRSFKDATTSTEPFDQRYSRLLGLGELFNRMLSSKVDRANTVSGDENVAPDIGKIMYEKNVISALTAALAEIDLNFPNAKRAVKYILGPLKKLTFLGVVCDSLRSTASAGESVEDDDISTAPSASDEDDENEREQTPDLLRNTTLGILESGAGDEESESGSEDEDEEMYDEYDEEMDYEEEPVAEHGDVVSDEDEDVDGIGHIEGLPGDVDMDVEIVMDGEPDSEDDDEADSDDDDDDDDDDDEGLTEFGEILDEINAEEEHASGEDHDDEEDWEEDGAVGFEEEHDIDDGMSHHRDPLEHIAHVLGADEHSDPGDVDGVVRIGMGGGDEEFFEDEMAPDDAEEEDEEADYENDVIYEPEMEEDDEDGQVEFSWSAPAPPTIVHRHHHPAGLPRGFNEMFGMIGGDFFRPPNFRTHRTASTSRGEDDGMNPLLQREGHLGITQRDRDNGADSILARLGRRAFSPMVNGGRDQTGFVRAPGENFIHNLVTAVSQPSGENGTTINVNLEGIRSLPPVFSVTGRPGGHALIDLNPGRPWREQLPVPFWNGRSDGRAGIGTDEAQAVHFSPTTTIARWQEEARMLFSGKHHEKATRVINTLMRLLVPPAMEAKRRADKANAELEAEQARLLQEQRKKAEQERLEREAREKKEKEEREAREAEDAARRAQEGDRPQTSGGDMEGLETGPISSNSNNSGATEETTERITTTIRGREIDITTLGIDREYLEALPEDMREEVIMQQFQEQRTQAAQSGEQPTEISREFLEALPRDIQAELLRQEAADRRRREREEARRTAQQAGSIQAAQADEMNNADFIAMLDPGLRQAVLMDADENTLASLPEELQAEARALIGDRPPRANPLLRRSNLQESAIEQDPDHNAREENKKHRKPVAQMLDKAGVATLLRLLFVTMPQKAKNNLHSILSHACKNTQNRAEVISILLSILQDGTADVGAVERSFAHLSLKARQAGSKTPQPLKRALSGQLPLSSGAELSPLNIVHQCLTLLNALAHDNPRVPSFFLNEHETSANQRGKATKKGKGRENRAAKYPLNALLTLLDRKLITENTGVMEVLASLLSRVTQPLVILLRRAREAQEAELKNADSRQEERPSTSSDVSMAEATGESTRAPNEDTNLADENIATGDAEIDKKQHKQLSPPEVPEENIRLVVNILAARECPSKTFSDTLDIIKNLSAVPGAKEAFGRELVRQAQGLGQIVVQDLEELASQIAAAQSGTDLQGMALANFSSAGSKQRKLLRVLLALDHLFDPKRMAQNPNMPSPIDPKVKDDVLALLYESTTFEKLWANLSLCLAAIRRRGNMVNVATILLPLIESFMVVCRNTTLKDASTAAAGTSALEVTVSSPPPESRIEGLFYQFTEDNRKILNELIRNNPKLLSGHLSILAKNSKVLEFDNKRVYFNRKLHHRGEGRMAHPTLQLNVRRDQVFLDSFKWLYYKSGDEIKYGKFNIRFNGEEGIDAGGVSREWFAAMARQMFNADYALFNPVASDRTTFHPNPLSNVNDEHLMFFKFIGRIIGKALYEGRVLDCYFSRAVYRRILGKSVSLKDMESLDLDYYKSLVWILENDITDVTFETFSVDISRFGDTETIDLIENGRNIPVTEENKAEYVRLVVEHRLIKSVEEQLDNFLAGFHEIIPPELIAIFNEQELELLISGLPEIDVEDWKNNTEYHNYQSTSPQIQWFWRAVRSFDKEEKAKLLQFVTGTSKVPLNGFKELEGMNGFAKFNIHRDYSSKEKLPSSHTCFNQLDLPEYESYEHLRQQLYTAITAGSEYFGFA